MKNKLLIILLTVIAVSLFTSELKADVFAHHFRVTQPTSNEPFDGSFDDGTPAAIRFVLSDKADSIWIMIYNSSNTLVRTILETNFNAGDTLIIWNGQDNGGTTVPTGTYHFEVKTSSVGYNQYTMIYNTNPPISTRGVTTMKNTAFKGFGFIYAASSGDEYATGASRHSADGTMWGDVKGNAKLTTTGLPLGGANARYSSEADNDGYIYVVGRDNRNLLRYHVDSLEVTQVTDSSGFDNFFLNSVAIRQISGGKYVMLSGTNGSTSGWTRSRIYGFELGNSPTYTGTKNIIFESTDIMVWDAIFGRDNRIYVTFFGRTDGLVKPGVAAFNFTGTPLTWADTLWTVRIDTGRGNTAAYYMGSTPNDDILYFTIARIASGNPALPVQNIYYVKNLYTTRDFGTAFVDLQNNMSITRSDIAVDAVGNVVFFENSNEEVIIIAPPFGYNSFTTPSQVQIQVVSAETIAAVKVDANNDFIPDRNGQVVTVIGTVNSINFTASSNRFSYFIQDATGGINITKGSMPGGGPVFNIGDRVLATGTVGIFNGTTQLNIDSVQRDVVLLSSGNPLTPHQISLAQYLANAEYYESMLIEINGLGKAPENTANWPAANSDANMIVWDGYNRTTLRLDRDTDIDGTTEPQFPIKVKGVATQFTTSNPPNDGYQISPNAYADITPNVAVPPSPYFFLNSPANNSVITVTSETQQFTANWRKSIDLNGDPIIYQFVLLKSPVYQSGVLNDTVFNYTGSTVLGWLGTADTLITKWTVRAKGNEPTIVPSVDTFNVTFIKNIIGVKEDFVPVEFFVDQNYPNPFNPSTQIKFGLPEAAVVDLRVYNILGQEVAVLLNNKQLDAGIHSTEFNASKLSTGTYIYRLKSGNNVVTKKMILIK